MRSGQVLERYRLPAHGVFGRQISASAAGLDKPRLSRGVVAGRNGPAAGGELLTKPLRFSGSQLSVNFATSAAGTLQLEIQDENGQPVPGYSLPDAVEQFGDETDRVVTWKHGADVSRLSGRTVRLRFVLSDADLYSLQFQTPGSP